MMFHFKLAMHPWKRAPFTQLFSVATVSILLFLAGFTFWLSSGLRPIVSHLNNNQVLTAYLAPSVTQKDETTVKEVIIDTLSTTIGAKALNDLDLEVVGSEKFLEKLGTAYPDLGSRVWSLGTEMNSIIPRYISISGNLPKGIENRLSQVSGIESVESSLSRHQHTTSAFKTLDNFSTLLFGFLFLILLMTLVQLGRSNAHLMSKALEVMKQWGAGSFDLFLPPLLSGLLIGLLGAIVAIFAGGLIAPLLLEKIQVVSPFLGGMGTPPVTYALWILGVGIIAGSITAVLTAIPKQQYEK